MDLQLQNKRALIFGSSAGIGYAIAKALKDEGAEIAICSRSSKKIKASALQIGADHHFSCDLSVKGEGQRGVLEATDKMGGVDILVYNTGGPPGKTFEEVKNDEWNAWFQTLWMGAVDAINTVLPQMKERGFGRIILIASISSKEPVPNLAISNGLRAGLLGLMKTISKEVASYGITVNVILPGLVETERLVELGMNKEENKQSIPMKRFGQPEEIASLATFLASEKANYISGQAIACDGGRLGAI